MNAAGAKERLIVRHAKNVRRALAGSLDPNGVASAWLGSDPASDVTVEVARAWAARNVQPTDDVLAQVLTQMYADGWVFATTNARAKVGYAAGLKKAPATLSQLISAMQTDWDNWKPGNAAAAAIREPSPALSRLLQRRSSTLNELKRTTVDRVGTLLHNALSQGWSAGTLASEIRDMVGDPQRAMTIARTEIARASVESERETYRDLGVEMVEYLIADPCDDCLENYAVAPIPLGDSFPEGDPPVHPNCMCDLAPYVEFDSLNVDFEKSGVPTPMDVSRALARLAILPNPPVSADNPEPEQTVESPWRVMPVPTIAPDTWDRAELAIVDLAALLGTDKWLWRDNLRKHIKALGQAITPNRSLALILDTGRDRLIIDGHHRLMAWWLLGQDKAPVWIARQHDSW